MNDDEAYEVGFGKPPRRTQFAKGKSGNPRGRPKGALNVATMLERILVEKVIITLNGRRRRSPNFRLPSHNSPTKQQEVISKHFSC
jgi:uncharacterized protein DUF5681